ncbi:Deoxycytidine kinase [Dichanthelium oligosanthes]|uniref:Deoxycytidine kinase n=1 Tax=Dichanthelium oligosanthes TaxID=888268 RepID=A0A1E5VV94_9POAL|nr:Deoxycytidine kinase [Dichanthelium oligosanthes]
MHRLSLTVIDAAAAMPAALRLGVGSPALRLAAARHPGPRPPPWLRFGAGAGARRGLLCSAEAARRGGDGEDAEAEEARRGGGGRAAAERRMRGGSAAAAAVGTSVELLAIPGVGPRNLRKLVDNGFEGVAQLKQLYRDKQFFGKSSEQMVEFLQSSVGIVHKNHAESITSFIKESVDEELKDTDSSKHTQKKRLTFCVEGNISVGKTTFLQRIANETIELRDLVEIVPEPIDKWQDVGPDHFNILDAFYAEPHRYAYTFQNYVFVTRVMQERESQAGIKPLRLMERSVFSDRMVFVRAVHEANWMNEMEISIYDSWFDPVVSSLPGLIPDGFIYLRASPDTCHKRMMHRRRSEEGGVTLDYLQGLHEKHESWLLPSKGSGPGVLSVSQLPMHMEGSLPPEIRDRVFYLEGNHMHSSIQKVLTPAVLNSGSSCDFHHCLLPCYLQALQLNWSFSMQVPALVLDCEPDIDFNKDIEAKRQYARQVAEFFELVKKKKEEDPSEQTSTAKDRMNPQVMLPNRGRLWVPEGSNPFAGSPMNLDFRRAMSSYLST